MSLMTFAGLCVFALFVVYSIYWAIQQWKEERKRALVRFRDNIFKNYGGKE